MNTHTTHPAATRRSDARAARPLRFARLRRAFTLVEILVVVAIIVIATTIILPAFGQLLQSANYSAAINTVSATLGNARALAMQNQRETGVVFLFDIETQRCTLLIVEAASPRDGSLTANPSGARYGTHATVFRPARNTVPIELPRNTLVAGLALGNKIARNQPVPSNSPDPTRIDADTAHWYTGFEFQDPDDISNWITPWLFPRNDARLYMDVRVGADPGARDAIGRNPWSVLDGSIAGTLVDARRAVRHANTFFIQYDAQGSIIPSSSADANSAYLEWIDLPIDYDAPADGPFDDPTTFDPEADGSTIGVNPSERSPNPEVVLRSADQLAIIDVALIRSQTAIERPWLVTPDSALAYENGDPDWLNRVNRLDIQGNPLYFDNRKVKLISNWIDRNAEVLAFSRYTGQVVRRAAP